MTTVTEKITSFIEDQVNDLGRQHQHDAPELSFEEYLQALPRARSPHIYWDHESTIIRASLFGQFGDFEVFQYCDAFNRVLVSKGIQARLTGLLEGCESGAQYFFA